MKLIVGIGNPGKEYENTRHNAGAILVDELRKQNLPKDIVVRKSDVFMNDSGGFVSDSVKRYSISPGHLYIVHDDLDIKLGEYKIQLGHSPKDHNGIKSVDEVLETPEYWHVKIGIDNRPNDFRPMGIEYVLQDFTDYERGVLGRVIKEICRKLKKL